MFDERYIVSLRQFFIQSDTVRRQGLVGSLGGSKSLSFVSEIWSKISKWIRSGNKETGVEDMEEENERKKFSVSGGTISNLNFHNPYDDGML